MPPFFFQPITYDCVKTRILSLVNDKSHGLYFSPTCPTKLLKCSIDIIAPVLSELFYISVSLGRYPTKLKLSKIVPVFKFDDETDPNNYQTTSSPLFLLRHRRSHETRARVKITPREKRRYAAGREKIFSLPAACRLFSRGVIFTRARVSLSRLSLRKNGGLLVV